MKGLNAVTGALVVMEPAELPVQVPAVVTELLLFSHLDKGVLQCAIRKSEPVQSLMSLNAASSQYKVT